MMRTPYHIRRLQDELTVRQKANPAYSLRAFGRDMGIHPSTLSQAFKGNRPLPVELCSGVVKKLHLNPKEKKYFEASFRRRSRLIDQISIPDQEQFLLDESYYKVIAEWEHYAVLSLFDLVDFVPAEAEIAKRLSLTSRRVKAVVENLIQSNLLSRDADKLVRKYAQVKTTEDIVSAALQKSHLETLDLAKNKLKEFDVDERDFSSTTIAVDKDKIPELKQLIREFRAKVSEFCKTENRNAVYQVSVQLFPLSERRKNR